VLRLLQPLNRFLGPSDPWEHINHKVPVTAFARGSHHEMKWYFEGVSRVEVRSIEDMHAWLCGCEYTTDLELFQEPDFWQHPRTFEQIRRGDCEDFSLWAWRKLVELGMDAEFVVGRRLPYKRGDAGHAWVMLRRDGIQYVYEPGCRELARALRPLSKVRNDYMPTLGVGADRKPFAFEGYLVALRDSGSDDAPVEGAFPPASRNGRG
jgi:hypothetical protein